MPYTSYTAPTLIDDHLCNYSNEKGRANIPGQFHYQCYFRMTNPKNPLAFARRTVLIGYSRESTAAAANDS